jgi:hypothetical protein
LNIFFYFFFRFIVLLLNIKLYNIRALLFYLICFVRDYLGLMTISRIWKVDFNELRLVVLVFFNFILLYLDLLEIELCIFYFVLYGVIALLFNFYFVIKY